MREGKQPCVFWKVLYQSFKDKKIYNFLLRILLLTENIHKFDYILLTNKFLKMKKYFTSKQTNYKWKILFVNHCLYLFVGLFGFGLSLCIEPNTMPPRVQYFVSGPMNMTALDQMMD